MLAASVSSCTGVTGWKRASRICELSSAVLPGRKRTFLPLQEK